MTGSPNSVVISPSIASRSTSVICRCGDCSSFDMAVIVVPSAEAAAAATSPTALRVAAAAAVHDGTLWHFSPTGGSVAATLPKIDDGEHDTRWTSMVELAACLIAVGYFPHAALGVETGFFLSCATHVAVFRKTHDFDRLFVSWMTATVVTATAAVASGYGIQILTGDNSLTFLSLTGIPLVAPASSCVFFFVGIMGWHGTNAIGRAPPAELEGEKPNSESQAP